METISDATATAGIHEAEEKIVEFVKTLTWEQIEHWQRDNEYILSGYRK